MSDISKEELKKEIAAILKNANLNCITTKTVRQDVESKLDIDLSSRRKEVDELVMDFLEKDKGKKNGNAEDDDEEEDDDNDEEEEDDDEDDEEEEEVKKPKRSGSKKAAPAKRYKSGSSEESDDASDGGDDDDYAPKKKGGTKTAGKRGGKKKGGSDDDSDEDWGKGKKKSKKAAGGAKRSGGGGGYTKPINLSPELAALVGESQMPRHEVVKRIWAIIKERNLYDPKNKQFAICDDELMKVFGVKRFRTFGMMKFLKNHFLK